MADDNQSQTHYNIKDYFNRLEILDKMPKPPSYTHPGSDYDRIYNTVKGIITNMKFFDIPKIGNYVVPPKEINISFDALNLLNESSTLSEKTNLKDLINPNFTPEYTYIRPFYKYSQNGESNYGNTPLEEYDFIFVVIYSILEHYTFKKPELLQSMYTLLENNTDSLFPCLYVNLAEEDKKIIREKIISALYNFGIQKEMPRKQFPTKETIENNGDVFTFINSLFGSYSQNSGESVPIKPHFLALMNFGELICKKADSLIPQKEKSDFNLRKDLGRYILIARQLAEAFYVNINLCIFGYDPQNPATTCENIPLKTSESKFISTLYIFITKDLCFAGKLIMQNYWNSDKIVDHLLFIDGQINPKIQPILAYPT